MFGKVEELVVVLIIILVLFGGKKLPEMAKGIGESVKELRRGISGDINEDSSKKATKTKKTAKK